MANPENKQIPYESTQKDIRDAIESVATAIGGIAVPSADHVSYDNSVSGLSATDVQNALDEIVSDIPTVNNGTLTIQQNGTSIGSFSANTASNVTANIKTPTADKKTATTEFDTADGGLLSKCQINLVPVQSGSGDPSPDNIRPISGHTEVDLYNNVGKNKFGVSIDEHYTINADGSIATRQDRSATIEFVPISGNTNYTLSYAETIDNGVFFYDSNKTFLSYLSWEVNPRAFTSPSDASYVRFSFSAETAPTKVQLELGSTATPYEPYLGHLYQVQIGSTVYGGTIDLVSGVMSDGMSDDDLSSLSWSTRYTGSTNKALSTTLTEKPLWTSSPRIFMCEQYKYYGNKAGASALSNPDAMEVGVYSYYSADGEPNAKTLYIVIPISDIPNGKIVYQVNSPQTINLTPQQIETLAGQNNLSTPLSGQSIETNGVEYKELFTFADVKEYVDKKIPDAPTTDGTYTLQAVVSGGVPTYSWV